MFDYRYDTTYYISKYECIVYFNDKTPPFSLYCNKGNVMEFRDWFLFSKDEYLTWDIHKNTCHSSKENTAIVHLDEFKEVA